MDCCIRYGLEFNPFLKNSKDIFYKSAEFKEVQSRLEYLKETKGFGILTGEPGRGKTTAIRYWKDHLNSSQYKIVYTSLSTLTVAEFYRNLIATFGLIPKYKKPDNFKILQNEIIRYSVEKRITPVIIIDEANHISNAILNDLKIIFNFDMDSKDRAVILLAGLPQLNHTLRLSTHEALRQRITMNYNMDALSKDETKDYIKTKLKKANSSKEIFNENALEAIANASNGVPRIINKYCNSAINIGNNKGVDVIDEEIVLLAVNDCELG